MQYLKTFQSIIFLACLLLYSCGGKNSNSTTGKDNSSGNSTASTSTAGNTSFSAVIDGTPFSGDQIDDMQLTNTAFIYPASENSPEHLLFFLNSNKKGEDFYSFRFSFPNKEGTYEFTYESKKDCNCYLILDNNLRSSDNFSRYNEDSVTVMIDKITSSRIAGTFSGILKLSDDTRSKPYKSNVVITDGNFDIPFSTSNIRPE